MTPNDSGKQSLLARTFSRENLSAAAICLILTIIIILTSDNAPQWIYQGF
ncbi:MAG TPA: hypothetical protein VI547_00445 [Anaerolineales bacterium]|nr:hypothetical protein [Anaerolineales bacterium]